MPEASGDRPQGGSALGGRARRLVGARVTDAHELRVGAVVCVHDRRMDEPWCLVASEASVPTSVLIRVLWQALGD